MGRLELMPVQPRVISSMYYLVLFLLSFICVCVELFSVVLFLVVTTNLHIFYHLPKTHLPSSYDYVKAMIDF